MSDYEDMVEMRDERDALAARLAEAERILAALVDGSPSVALEGLDDAIMFLGPPRITDSAQGESDG